VEHELSDGEERTKAKVNKTVMGWLQQHLETFVKPVLGFIPDRKSEHATFFSPQEMAVIKGMWKAVKRESVRVNKPLLLAGRDVFVWEILARRENFPTVFRPDISRLTVSHLKEDYSDHFLFDTGFAGSIPRQLGSKHYTMGSSNYAHVKQFDPFINFLTRTRGVAKHQLLTEDPKQVFPRLTGARSLILKIERTPKYWQRAFYRDPNQQYCECPNPYDGFFSNCWECNKPRNFGSKTPVNEHGIGQAYSDLVEFTQAALLTIDVYIDKSPAFVEKPANVGSRSSLNMWSEGMD
jgi:hypothetical protein